MIVHDLNMSASSFCRFPDLVEGSFPSILISDSDTDFKLKTTNSKKTKRSSENHAPIILAIGTRNRDIQNNQILLCSVCKTDEGEVEFNMIKSLIFPFQILDIETSNTIDGMGLKGESGSIVSVVVRDGTIKNNRLKFFRYSVDRHNLPVMTGLDLHIKDISNPIKTSWCLQNMHSRTSFLETKGISVCDIGEGVCVGNKCVFEDSCDDGCIQWVPNSISEIFVTHHNDIYLMDTRVPDLVVQRLRNTHMSSVETLDISPLYNSTKQIATGGQDNLINIWDTRKLLEQSQRSCLCPYLPLLSIDIHRNFVKNVKYHPSCHNILLSSSLDGNIYIHSLGCLESKDFVSHKHNFNERCLDNFHNLMCVDESCRTPYVNKECEKNTFHNRTDHKGNFTVKQFREGNGTSSFPLGKGIISTSDIYNADISDDMLNYFAKTDWLAGLVAKEFSFISINSTGRLYLETFVL